MPAELILWGPLWGLATEERGQPVWAPAPGSTVLLTPIPFHFLLTPLPWARCPQSCSCPGEGCACHGAIPSPQRVFLVPVLSSLSVTTAPTSIPLGAALKGVGFMMGQEATGWGDAGVGAQRLRWMYRATSESAQAAAIWALVVYRLHVGRKL